MATKIIQMYDKPEVDNLIEELRVSEAIIANDLDCERRKSGVLLVLCVILFLATLVLLGVVFL